MFSPTLGAWVILAAAAVVFPALFFVTAPYGRHTRQGFGPQVPARAGWAVMEAVSLATFAWTWATNPQWLEASVVIPAALYGLHYFNRSVLTPLLMRGRGKLMPVMVVAMAVLFNSINGSSNGAALGRHPMGVQFWAGVALFVAGAALNLQSDAVLRALRPGDDSGYHVPHGGFFRWVSSPNYLGELVEWAGFALAAGTLPALAFFVFTAANLVPRAWDHHRWYRKTFPDYPKTRRALLPGIF